MSEPDVDRPDQATGPRRIPVRRSPRYGAFLLTGAALGVLVAIVAGLSGTPDASTSRGALVGYLAMILGLLGGLLGGLAAVLVESVSRRGGSRR